ncbi:hypothetical protein [Bacteroides pyogenes]|uniref:hypothetical protein n=1 Tax=Bacteroides pyogenes TaxID=310300 RepID=UPI001F1A1631|nr:hypothetical protein [Bacteroides pyogenes]MCE9107652.1 hypothetical protein [Bacteroides pyogenes]
MSTLQLSFSQVKNIDALAWGVPSSYGKVLPQLLSHKKLRAVRKGGLPKYL